MVVLGRQPEEVPDTLGSSCCFGMLLHLLNQKDSGRTFTLLRLILGLAETLCSNLVSNDARRTPGFLRPNSAAALQVWFTGDWQRAVKAKLSDLVGTPAATRFSFFKDGIDRNSKRWTDENYKSQPQLAL